MKNLITVLLLIIIGFGIIYVGNKFLKRQAVINNNSSYGVDTTNKIPEKSGNITLEITTPNNGQTLNSASVTVEGMTIPNAEVSVNDVDTKADASGKFSANINLDEGENTIVIVANDKDGNFLEKELVINFE